MGVPGGGGTDLDESAADRDALFGLIALQRGVDAAALGAAIDACAGVAGKSLGRTLVDRGAIREQDYAEIDREIRSRTDPQGDPDPSRTVAATIEPAKTYRIGKQPDGSLKLVEHNQVRDVNQLNR